MKKFHKIFAFFYFLLITIIGYSQLPGNNLNPNSDPVWNWSKKYAGSGGPLSKDIISDGNGNYFLTGNFNGSLTFNSITINSSGTSDLFIIKVNSSGDALWVKKVAASDGKSVIPCKLVLLGNGDFLVGGNFDGTASFPANSLVSSGHTDAFVARYDANGNNLWAGKYSDAESLSATGLAADANGISYMTANTTSATAAKIIIFSSSGQPAGTQTFSNTVFTGIACRNSNLAISGYLKAAASFGSINLSSGYYPSSFTGQTDLSGNFIWADNGKCASATSSGYSVAIDGNGNIYTTGYFMDSIRFNPPATKLTADGAYPLFIVKYSPAGTCLWASQIGEAEAYDYHPLLSLDNQGNPFVISYFYFGLTFGSTTLNGSAAFIASYSPAGTKQWAKSQPYFPNRAQFQTNNEIIECAENYFNTQVIKFDASANLLWTKQSASDGGMSDCWYMISVDHEGMPYFHGHAQGTNYFDGNAVETNGANLVKLNGDGSVIWQKSFTMPKTQSISPSGIVNDLANNCYAWGTFTDSLTIEGTLLRNTYGNGYMAYIVKCDKQGAVQWTRTLETDNTITGVGGITADKAGNVLITGWFYDTLHINNIYLVSHGNGVLGDIFLIKYAPDGSLVFASNFGGTQSTMGRSVSSDLQNNIYLSGGFRGTVTFGNYSLTSLGSYDAFIVKCSPDGTPVWAKQAGGTGTERAHVIVTDSAGNSYVSGLFWSTLMHFGNISITSPYINNLFLAKYSPDGTPLWAHAQRSAYYTWPAYQMGLDEEGGCYMAGTYQDSLSFDNGPSIAGQVYNNFLVKYDSQGTYQWNKNISQSAFSPGYTDMMSLTAFNKNSILVGGRITNDTLTLGTNKLYSFNSGAFVALLGDDLPLGTRDKTTDSGQVKVYPNPASGILNLKLDEPAGTTITYSIFNEQGKPVFSGKVKCEAITTIRLPQLQTGVYFISVNDGSKLFHEKFILR